MAKQENCIESAVLYRRFLGFISDIANVLTVLFENNKERSLGGITPWYPRNMYFQYKYYIY